MKILIIEDDISIRNELAKFLKSNNYAVDFIENFQDIVEQIKAASPHLILLDVNLPQTDGYSICRKLREFSTIPVIILTSRDTEMDELMSMNLGADDFVRKPFNPQILLARIERILRRTYISVAANSEEHNGLVLDKSKGTISYNNNTEVLTKNEISIISFLLIHKGELVSREDLMTFLWDDNSFVDDNTLSVNITRIRKKLSLIGLENVIETRRGIGYMLL